MLFGGSDEGPRGPSWLIHGTLSGLRWVRIKKADLAVLEDNYWSLPSQNVAKENWLVLGVNIAVWGL